jgi:hypothetical protein
MLDFDKRYEEYKKEAESIRTREKTACMTRPNVAEPFDPKKWSQIDDEEIGSFWEASKCLTT